VVLSGDVSSPQEIALLNNVIAAFEATHPRSGSTTKPLDKLPAEMGRDSLRHPPDVFYVDATVCADWIAKGFLQPLDRFARRPLRHEPLLPVLRAAFEGPHGNTYGFPKDWSPLAMFP